MQKKNIFKKKINRLVLSITKRIESFFNFFREKISYKKKNLSKSLRTVDKKIFLTTASILIIVISYLSIPVFYDKNKIKVQLENQIFKQFNLKVKFDQTFRYGLFPRPHFSSKNTIIEHESNNIAKSNNTKVFISLNNFFLSDKLEIKKLLFKQTEFGIKSSNFNFFKDLLNYSDSNENIYFINSKFFYLDQNGDVVFLSSLKKLNYINQETFVKKLISKFEIFNVPVNLETKHNILEKNFLTEINAHPLRLNIKDNANYSDEKLNGQLDLTIINKSKKIDYILKDNSFTFNSNDNVFTGDINIKPFFLNSNFELNQVDLKKIFHSNSILINILKSEILNNKNLNGKININANSFKGLNFLDQIKFNILFEEGDIFIQNLKTTFKKSVIIDLSDIQLIVDNNNLKFAGYATLELINVNEFFAHYQINRSDRKNIKKITFGFLFNFDEEFIEFDNLKIDGKSYEEIEKFLSNFNSKKENIFNKIIRRNSVKSFFKIF